MFRRTKKRILVIVGITFATAAVFGAGHGLFRDAYVSALTSDPFVEMDVKVAEALTFECTENGGVPKPDSKYSFELRDENKYDDSIPPVYRAENAGGGIFFDYEKILDRIHDKINSSPDFAERFDLNFSVKQVKGNDPNTVYDETGYTIRISVVYSENEDLYKVTDVSFYKNDLPAWEQVKSVSFNNYVKEEHKPELKVEETDRISGGTLKGGKVYTYTINVRNDGNAPAENVYIRRYMPEYTNFVPNGREGSFDDPYDCTDGRESVRWVIDSLKEGESRSFRFSFSVNVCKPGRLKKSHEVQWEIVGSDHGPGFLKNDPANKN